MSDTQLRDGRSRWLLSPAGVYPPQGDTWLLAAELRRVGMPAGASVLDVGTGTGALAVAAAKLGAARVTAIDVSRRAVLTARANAWARRLPVTVRRGDLFGPVAGMRFDVILANPPYVPGGGATAFPAAQGRTPARRWTWDGGTDGRDQVDRVCAAAPSLLSPGGVLLLVHSALCGVSATLRRLREHGLTARVVAREPEPFGPVMRARADRLERLGLIAPGQRFEELVVVRADQAA